MRGTKSTTVSGTLVQFRPSHSIYSLYFMHFNPVHPRSGYELCTFTSASYQCKSIDHLIAHLAKYAPTPLRVRLAVTRNVDRQLFAFRFSISNFPNYQTSATIEAHNIHPPQRFLDTHAPQPHDKKTGNSPRIRLNQKLQRETFQINV